MSTAPVSSITDFTDPFDPTYAHQTWDSDDGVPASTSHHSRPSLHPSEHSDYHFPGLPLLSSSALPSRDYQAPPRDRAPDYNYKVGEDDYRHHLVSPRERSPERQPLQRSHSVVSAMDEVEYTIPIAPPPPLVPPDTDIADYDRSGYQYSKLEFDSHPDSGAHPLNPSSSGRVAGVSHRPSVAHRLGGALKGAVSRTRSSAGNRRSARRSRPENYTGLEGVEEKDEAFNVSGFDLSTIEAEFVPAPAIKAMNEHQFNEDMAYTGRSTRAAGASC